MKKTTKIKNETTGQEFVSTTISPGLKTNQNNPIEHAKAEIQKEREESKYKTKSKLFDVQIGEDDDHFTWITQMFCEYFKLGPVGFKSNVTAWNFPKAIGNPLKRHKVKRQYVSRGIMVDVFDQGTKKEEILRIKAHLEAIGHLYTYIIGGESLSAETIFGKRLKKLDPKSADYPKIKVPLTLGEAGFVGHNVAMV